MKTITAKEFQRNHASIVKEVADGHEYEVTFHRKPLIKLVPISTTSVKEAAPGSRAAVIKSLRYTLSAKGELHDLPYKQLRERLLKKRHGA